MSRNTVARTAVLLLAAAAWSACADSPVTEPERASQQADALYRRMSLQQATDTQRESAPAGDTRQINAFANITGDTSSNLITNGSFEKGFLGWTATVTNGSPFAPWTQQSKSYSTWSTFERTAPQDGQFLVANGFDGSAGVTYRLAQAVTIPATGAVLTWKYRLQWDFSLGGFASIGRTFTVRIEESGALRGTVFSYTTPTQSQQVRGNTGWVSASADLSAFAGRKVAVVFQEVIPQSSTGPAMFELDDVRMIASEPTDETPPSIESIVNPSAPDGDNGWYTSDIDLSWLVSDAESQSSVVTSGCGAQSIASDQEETTYTCAATSDGGSASASVSLKRDATAPAIAYDGNAGAYTVDETVEITCAVSDATSGTDDTCDGTAGAAYSYPAGTTTLNASAADRAGNSASATTSFSVAATEASLCAVVRQVASSSDVADGLCDKLNAMSHAKNARARAGQEGAFEHLIAAQRGKSISEADADMLLRWVRTL